MSPETVSLTTLAKQQSLNLTDLEPIILRGQENAIDGITKIESSTPQVPANHRNPCEKSTELISGDATGEQPIDLTCQGTKDTTQTAGCTKTLPTDGDTSHGLHQKAPREPRHARKEHQMTRGVKQEANADLIRALRIQPLFTSIDFDGTGLILGQNVVQILQRYRVKRPERILENLGFRTESTVSRQILTDAILTAFRMEKSASTFAYLLATVCIDELKTLTKMEEAWVESPNGNKGPSNFLECAKVDELMEAKRTLEAEIEEMRLSRQLGSEFAVKVEQLSVTNNRLNFERFREAELRSATLETTSEIKLVGHIAQGREFLPPCCRLHHKTIFLTLTSEETNERLREEIRQLTQTSADLRKRLDETGESVQGQAKTLSDAMDKNIELRVELERTHDALENEMRFSDVQKRENEYLNAMLERLTKELSEMRNLYRESEGTRCANRVEITALQEKRLFACLEEVISQSDDLRCKSTAKVTAKSRIATTDFDFGRSKPHPVSEIDCPTCLLKLS
uniref:EF-hand domain-containing protein n=1 Tax=Mesocestoides corti TaxID=53468 RepID=A0A5K3F4U5_MESCO